MRTPGSAVRLASLLAVPLLLAGALAGLNPAPARAAAADCRSVTGAQPPSPGDDGELLSTAVLSACNVWAVGSFRDGDVFKTLIEHWDGANWTVVPSPSPGTDASFLFSVRAASPTNIWAVGDVNNGGAASALVLHWSGATWVQQKLPNLGSGSAELLGVRAVSGSEAWAVGDTFSTTTQKSLVLHFTGGAWHRVSTPHVSNDDKLIGVAATSARGVWAVGEASSAPVLEAVRGPVSGSPRPGSGPVAPAVTSIQTLVLHWNGTRWAHVPSPSPNNADFLLGVGASSPTSALAVGDEETASGGFRTLALRWNGRAWTKVPAPSPGPATNDDFLEGVTMTAPGSAWAVGASGTGNNERPLIAHWNGSRWTMVTSPDPGGFSPLFGIGASSAGNIWAVGQFVVPFGNQPFALHCC
jgi:hypothetical protein